MELDELMEDILLKLLVHRVENEGRGVDIEVLKLRLGYGGEDVEKALNILKDEGLVEREEDTLRITREGIDCIVERV